MFLARLRPSQHLIQVLVPIILVLSIPALAFAHSETAPAAEETLNGELLLLHTDDFRQGRTTQSYALRTKHEFVEVDLSHVRGASRLAGKRVRLEGETRGGVFVAANSSVSPDAQSSTATVAATTTRRVAVLLVNFTNDAGQPWSREAVGSVVFGASSSVNAFHRETSYDATAMAGDVLGWFTIPYDNTGCRYSDWARAAELQAGVDLSGYQHVVYAFPRASSCGWAGLGSLKGRYSWINGSMTVRVVAHELGHNLGVHHASSLSCTENGVRVTLSATCTPSEYGDPFSVMGSTTRHHNNWHRAQIGWLPDVVTVAAGGTYTVAPASLTGTPRLVRVPRGNGTYFYLELRQPFGAYDSFPTTDPAVNGVTIRVAPEMTTRSQSLLLDTTPSTTSFADSPLAVGRTFTDAVSGVSVTTTSVSPSGATVNVSVGGSGGDSQAPTAPGGLTATPTSPTSVLLAWSASTDNVAVAGYRVYRNGTLVATKTSPGHTDSGLGSGATYAYSVVAFDAAGNTSTAATAGATTPVPPDTSAPTTPGGLSATPASPTSVSLAWNASTDNVGVTGYRVYRDDVLVSTTAVRTFADPGRTAATTYRYAVVAFDAAGNTSGPAAATATTPAQPATTPSAPTGLAANRTSRRTVALSWSAGTGGGTAVGYRVYRNGTLVGSSAGTGYSDGVPANLGSATYVVTALDAAGNASLPSSSVTIKLK